MKESRKWQCYTCHFARKAPVRCSRVDKRKRQTKREAGKEIYRERGKERGRVDQATVDKTARGRQGYREGQAYTKEREPSSRNCKGSLPPIAAEGRCPYSFESVASDQQHDALANQKQISYLPDFLSEVHGDLDRVVRWLLEKNCEQLKGQQLVRNLEQKKSKVDDDKTPLPV